MNEIKEVGKILANIGRMLQLLKKEDLGSRIVVTYEKDDERDIMEFRITVKGVNLPDSQKPVMLREFKRVGELLQGSQRLYEEFKKYQELNDGK